MKKLQYAIALLLLFSIAATAILLVLSPDTIPAHYNASGQIDRFGSKWETLIWPGFVFLICAVFYGIFHYQRRSQAPQWEQKTLLCTAAFSIALMDALELFFGIAAIRYTKDSAVLTQDMLAQFICIFTGVLLILFGNIMPKARRNGFFGLRTKWSMANDTVWQRSQRFVGIAAVLCGTAMIALTALLPAQWCTGMMTGLMLLWILSSILASWKYWRAESPHP